MFRGFMGRLAARSNLFNRQARGFAADAPALGKDGQTASAPGLVRYVNGELVRRSDIVLKKHEDIEG